MASSLITLRRYAASPRLPEGAFGSVRSVGFAARGSGQEGRENPDGGERCELCAAALAPEHRHLLVMATRAIACACDSCALLFQKPESGRFKLIPRGIRVLPESLPGDPSGHAPSDAEWENLALPIDMAFFVQITPSDGDGEGAVEAGSAAAFYPSPAGAAQSLLPVRGWKALEGIAPDVEALLVNRTRNARDAFVVPIDVCYRLVGLIRLHWRGLHGGDEVWRQIDRFFDELRQNTHTCESPLGRKEAHA